MRVSRIRFEIAKLLVPVIALVATTACGTETPTAAPSEQGWELVDGSRGRVATDPTAFMKAVGCRDSGTRGDTGSIALPLPAGGLARFDCKSVAKTAIRQGLVEFSRSARAAMGGAFMTSLPGEEGGGYWAWVGTACSWVAGGQVGYSYLVGNQLYTVVTGVNGYCNWIDEYGWVSTGESGGSGGSGGGGGGSTSTTEPVRADSVFMDGSMDGLQDSTTFACPAPSGATDHQKRWCAPVAMTATDSSRIQNAIDRIRDQGGICVNLAATIDSVYKAGRIRLFSPSYPTTATYGAFAPDAAGGTGFIGISSDWVRYSYDRNHRSLHRPTGRRFDLMSALAHEGDHLMFNTNATDGNVHLPGTMGTLTTNTLSCSDLGPA